MFNWLKTAILMAAIMALFGIVGGIIGGKSGMLLALVFGGAMNLFSYWFSDSMVLKMYNAQQVDETSAPQFYTMIRDLAGKAGLPMPKVYIIDEAQPNAFATGRNPEHAAVAATTGIIQLLSVRELRGVMAHELAHVQHRDILISTISATMAGAISALANFAMFFGGRDEEGRTVNPLVGILVAVLAPLAASLIQMAISRAREFEADAGGAAISRDPNALADALGKIRMYAEGRVPMGPAEAHPETAQMMIMNPLSGEGLRGLFSTHPPTEERIARLRAMH
ncbi:MAG: zinc metalloprotease HtpX [Betaproteobacteria bacterium]|nr:zinc metalloprotease HtpX [Betaproteobacteria bacterium]